MAGILESAYGRKFDQVEVEQAALAANEFLTLMENGAEEALKVAATPRQLLFAAAIIKSDQGRHIKALVQSAADSARKGK